MFSFNLYKTIQATTYLLRQPGTDHCAYLKVLKLLYVAERESLAETGHPITGDQTYAMPHGPALSATLNLMNGTETHDLWVRHIQDAGNYELKVSEDPGTDLLCPYELEKLRDVARRYADQTRWQVRDATHELPEWKSNDPGQQSSKPIPVRDILVAQRCESRLGAIERDSEAQEALSSALGD
ncbi:MAG: SocA family protein [Phycisphaerae bacterium]|nr:SocA family protein [Phycisphaerae bacterium]